MTWYPGKIIGDVFKGKGNPERGILYLEKAFRDCKTKYGLLTLGKVIDSIGVAIAICDLDPKRAEGFFDEAKSHFRSWHMFNKEDVLKDFERAYGDKGVGYLESYLQYVEKYMRNVERAIRTRDMSEMEYLASLWDEFYEEFLKFVFVASCICERHL
ncbi:hypothetical protein DRJ16_02595 [Candidatus Woesearchaeota archaeon]|nr:MAG: hypothetical protein DRJ16_02595 [Candidatus Woesearchaeota archaeon]